MHLPTTRTHRIGHEAARTHVTVSMFAFVAYMVFISQGEQILALTGACWRVCLADRFEDMRTFVAIVQGGGFNAAADRLGLAKSAISRRIRDLEDRLGTRLIDRTTRRINLTQIGTEFYERSLAVLADLEEAENLASTGSRAATGRLRISVPVSLAHPLAPALHEFTALHRKIQIDVETNDRLVDLVREGFDLAIRIGQLKDSTLIARRITDIRHVCCASPKYLSLQGRPQIPADLRAHAGVAYTNVDSSWYWMFRDNQSVEPNGQLTINNGDLIREVAIAGAGIVMLPTFLAYRAIARGELEVILKEFARPPNGMYVVHPSSRNISAKARLFIEFLVARFSGVPSWDRGLFSPDEILEATGKDPIVSR